MEICRRLRFALLGYSSDGDADRSTPSSLIAWISLVLSFLGRPPLRPRARAALSTSGLSAVQPCHQTVTGAKNIKARRRMEIGIPAVWNRGHYKTANAVGFATQCNTVCRSVAPGAIATDFSGGMVRDNPELNKRVADDGARSCRSARRRRPHDRVAAFRGQSLDQRPAHRSTWGGIAVSWRRYENEHTSKDLVHHRKPHYQRFREHEELSRPANAISGTPLAPCQNRRISMRRFDSKIR
jgi:hypothetical protein